MQDILLKAKNLTKSDPDEALRMCCKVMDDDLDGRAGQMALFMAGYLMMEAERYGLAYHLYQRCAQLNPSISEIYSNMGMCLELSDPAKAKRMFQKAYQLNPENSHAYANEGLLHLQSGNPKRCIELSAKALEIEPDLSSAIHNTSLALIMLREWEEGWRKYYETLGVKHREVRDYGLPDWQGEGERLLFMVNRA